MARRSAALNPECAEAKDQRHHHHTILELIVDVPQSIWQVVSTRTVRVDRCPTHLSSHDSLQRTTPNQSKHGRLPSNDAAIGLPPSHSSTNIDESAVSDIPSSGRPASRRDEHASVIGTDAESSWSEASSGVLQQSCHSTRKHPCSNHEGDTEAR